MLKICDEPESPNEGAYLRYIMNRNAKWPNQGACLSVRYMMNRHREMKGRVEDI